MVFGRLFELSSPNKGLNDSIHPETLNMNFSYILNNLKLELLSPLPSSYPSCLQRNVQDLQHDPQHLHLQLQELPTLTEIEVLCRKQRPRKAPGPDGITSDLCRNGAAAIAPHLHAVLCKALIFGIEPVSYKGGQLCTIYKGKDMLDDAAAYRGILLTNAFAKISHAWARSKLLPTLKSRKTIGQLGGLPSQQTVTGIQLIRLHGTIGRQRKLSTATLFVDLRSAFHHMIREFVFANATFAIAKNS